MFSRAAALLGPTVVLLQLMDVAASKYASGTRRTGEKLVNLTPLEEHHVQSVGQCLMLCDRLSSCRALNFGQLPAGVSCQLFDQAACDGHQLEADPAVDYYDVTEQPPRRTELQMPFWDDATCTRDGYCAASCAAQATGEFCVADKHCAGPALRPAGAFACVNGTCQPAEGFWEVRPGLALPKSETWRMGKFWWTFKRLTPGLCSLDIDLRRGSGSRAWMSANHIDEQVATQLVFIVDADTVDLHYYDADGSKIQLLMDAAAPGMTVEDEYSRLRISWCGGAMAIGPEDNPTLVSAQASVTQPINYFMFGSENAPSWLRVDSGAADRWLFETAGVGVDPVFEVGSESNLMRPISPTVDVTVKYDCMAPFDCNTILKGPGPERLSICIGCWDNDASGLVYMHQDGSWDDHLFFNTGPVLSDIAFNTFEVRYNNGSVTAYRNGIREPFYAVQTTRLMPSITHIGIGGCCSRKFIRVARYDDRWRTDSWVTDGTGFSNMAEPGP